jgi:hypothetical protein
MLMERAPRVVPDQVTGLLEKSYISPYTTFLLPIRQLAPFESIHQQWTIRSFDRGLFDQVETEGVGRIFTHNKSTRGARAVRRGAAIKIEDGFYSSPEGREDWALQIEQLATAIQETNEYDVLLTLLQVPMSGNISAQDMNGPYNHMFYGADPDMTFSERLTLMKDMFSTINKSVDSRGFNTLIGRLRETMARSGVIPDTIIVPPNLVSAYYSGNDDQWHYMSAGPAVSQNRADANDIGGERAIRVQKIQGLNIVDTHIYRPVIGARASVNDLLTVPAQIGEFYAMCVEDIYRGNKNYLKYQSDHRDIKIFDEDEGRFVPIYFTEALKNTFRWDDTGNIDMSPITEGGTSTANVTDMFINGGATVKSWGDMNENYLPNEAITRVVNSIKGNMFTPEEWKEFTEKVRGVVAGDAGTVPDADTVKAAIGNFVATLNTAIVTGDINAALYTYIATKFKDMSGVGKNATADTSNLANRDQIFRNGENEAGKVVAAAFLMSTITRDNIIKMHESDVFVPINILLVRPWMTYDVGTIIVMRAGRDTGETIIGERSFQMSANTQDRTIEGSMMYYGKAIVKKPKNVMVAPNVFIRGYVRGNNTEWVTGEDLIEVEQKSGITESTHSLVAMLIPYGSKVTRHTWIDYRGKNPNTGNLEFHESAQFYQEVFKTEDADLYTPTEGFIDYRDETFPVNSICWAGHVKGGADFAHEKHCLGHLGVNTYDHYDNTRKDGYASMLPITIGIGTK